MVFTVLTPSAFWYIWRSKGKVDLTKITDPQMPARIKLPPLIPYKRFIQPLLDLLAIEAIATEAQRAVKRKAKLNERSVDDILWDMDFWMFYALAQAKIDSNSQSKEDEDWDSAFWAGYKETSEAIARSMKNYQGYVQ